MHNNVNCGNGNSSLGRVVMEYSAFDAIKDAKRYLKGEGGVGTDNAGGCGTAINAPFATKDTEVE